MATAPTPITALPDVPLRSSPSNFAARADNFLGALPVYGTQLNAIAQNVYANAAEAFTKAAEALASAAIAANKASEASSSAAQAAASASGLSAAVASATASAASASDDAAQVAQDALEIADAVASAQNLEANKLNKASPAFTGNLTGTGTAVASFSSTENRSLSLVLPASYNSLGTYNGLIYRINFPWYAESWDIGIRRGSSSDIQSMEWWLNGTTKLMELTRTGALYTASLHVAGSLNLSGTIRVLSTSYFVGNASHGYRFNNAADTFNLLRLYDTGGMALGNLGTQDPGAGNLLVQGSVTASVFSGPLTGAASLNVLKTGDTMTGDLSIAPVSGSGYLRIARSSRATGQVGLALDGGSDGATWSLYQPTGTSDLRIYGFSADRLVITPGGNVGIGTVNPDIMLALGHSGTGFYGSGAALNGYIAHGVVFNLTAADGLSVPHRLNILSGNGALFFGPDDQTFIGKVLENNYHITSSLAGDLAIRSATEQAVRIGTGITLGLTVKAGNVSVVGNLDAAGAAKVGATSFLGTALSVRSTIGISAPNTAVSGEFSDGVRWFNYAQFESAFINFRHNDYFGEYFRQLRFGLSGNTLMTIDNSGNVGIGTTSPGQKLEVAGANVMLKLHATTGSFAQLGYYENGVLTWNAYNDFNNGNYTIGNSGGARLSIQQAGNVGIGGVADPRYKLQVGAAGTGLNSAFSIVGNTGVAAVAGNKAIYLYNDGTNIKLDAFNYDGPAVLDFQIGGNGGNISLPNGIWKANGNVGIGTSSPVTKLAIFDGTSGLEFHPSGSINNAPYIQSFDRSTSAYQPLSFIGHSFRFYTPTVGWDSLVVTGDGRVGVGTGSPNTRFAVNNASVAAVAVSINRDSSSTGYANIRFDTGGVHRFYMGLDKDLTPGVDAFTFFDATASVTTMTLRSGQVGIGTKAPNATLEVSGGPAMSAGWNRTLQLSATYPVISLKSGTKYAGIGHDSGAGIYFWVNGTSDDIPSALSSVLISYDGTLVAKGALTVAGGRLDFTNPSSNTLAFNAAGVQGPTTTSRSIGTKMVLYPTLSGSLVDYAIGISDSTLWQSVPSSGSVFQWFGGTTAIATLTGAGNFAALGVIKAGAFAGAHGQAGDFISRRASTTGTYYFGDSANTYLHFDGVNYLFGNNGNGASGLHVAGPGLSTFVGELSVKGVVLDQRLWLQSARDFPNGTLIETDIPAPAAGDTWLLEVKGYGYLGGQAPTNFTVAGYIYDNNVYYNGSAQTTGLAPPTVNVFVLNGYLCFWWANQSYWQGFDVFCSTVTGSGRKVNRTTGISNNVIPAARTRSIAVTNMRVVLDSGNFSTYTAGKNSSGYLAPYNWIQLDGNYGLYAPYGDAHIRPNYNGSYGGWEISGSKNGWSGLYFSNPGINLMMSQGQVGFHNNSLGDWQLLWSSGSLYCYKGATGGGSQALVLDTINFNSYVPTLAQTARAGHLGGTNMDTYQLPGLYEYDPQVTSAPTGQANHRVISIGSSGRQTQVAFPWNTDQAFFRNKTDAAFGGWFEFIHSGNISTYALSRNLANGYYLATNWIQLASTNFGIFSTTNSAHIQPNDGTYGAWKITGSRNGWEGIEFGAGSQLMISPGTVGIHRTGYGWQLRWDGGNLYCSKASGSDAIVIDAVNLNNYAIDLATTQQINVTKRFLSSNNATHSGPVGTLECYSTNASGAGLSFHRGGYYAVNLGLDSDNVFRLGGWSDGASSRWASDPSGNFSTRGHLNVGTDIYLNNYGRSLVGVYSSTNYQGVFAMGPAYMLPADGSSPGSLYGIAWTHSNVGGQSKAGLGHQALFMEAGVTQVAIGNGIWTRADITALGNIVAVSAFYGAGTGLTGTAASLTAGNANLLNGISKSNIFNNAGAVHGAYTSFSAVPDFGHWFVHQSTLTDGPSGAGGGVGQYYVTTSGLGGDYSHASYAMMVAIKRTDSNPTIWVRHKENGTWGLWYSTNRSSQVIEVAVAVSGTAPGFHYAISGGGLTTLNLPENPRIGDMVTISPCNGLATNVVGRNGQLIHGLAQDMTMDNAQGTYTLKFLNATVGWRLI